MVYEGVKHQRFATPAYFDAVQQAIQWDGLDNCVEGSTEASQFAA